MNPRLPSSAMPPDPVPDGVIAIVGPLTIATVESWRVRILDTMDQSATPGLDFAAAGEIDVFGVQLLHAATRGAGERRKTLRVLNAGATLENACTAAGVDPRAIGIAPSLSP